MVAWRRLFGFPDTDARRRREAAYAVKTIEAFINGTGGCREWDDFTSCPLGDRELDGIRRRACMVDLPAGREELDRLRALLAEVQAVVRAQD